MSELDDLDFSVYDEDDVQCTRCKARGFYWGDHYDAGGNKSRKLFTAFGRLHKCGPQPSADAFDVVPE